MHQILTMVLGGRYFHYFVEGETEAQESYITYPRLHIGE